MKPDKVKKKMKENQEKNEKKNKGTKINKTKQGERRWAGDKWRIK